MMLALRCGVAHHGEGCLLLLAGIGCCDAEPSRLKTQSLAQLDVEAIDRYLGLSVVGVTHQTL